jgi:hypothetical protein
MAAAKKKKTTQKTTPKKRVEKFLSALAEYGNVKEAARIAIMDRRQLYRKRKNDAAFAAAWEEAEALGVSAVEDEARRRAYEGWDEPVFHKGAVCGTVRKFSDTLLIVLLKAHRPEKYRENINSTIEGGLTIKWQD